MTTGITVTVKRPSAPAVVVRTGRTAAPSVTAYTTDTRGPAGPPGEDGTDGLPGEGAIDTVARDAINTHLIDPTPHPAYDDLHDFTLIFENHLI